MKTEEHLKAFQEHRDAIDWAINRGMEKSQRILGAHASRGITELLSAYLHKINKIEPGFQINHRWFKSEKAGERFPDFPNKSSIIPKMVKLENMSENLTYGSQKSEKEMKRIIELLNELEKLLKRVFENEK